MLEGYNDLLTTDEVCEILHISRNSLYPLLQDKRIRGFQQGRIWKVPKNPLKITLWQWLSCTDILAKRAYSLGFGECAFSWSSKHNGDQPSLFFNRGQQYNKRKNPYDPHSKDSDPP